MSEQAILERFDRLERLIAQHSGERLTRTEMQERLGVSANTLAEHVRIGKVPPPFLDGKWLLYRVLEWEHANRREATDFEVRPKGHHLYRHFDASGKLLYVGISLHAVSRLVGHKNSSPWVWSIARMEVETYSTRKAAEQAEREAIENERPLFNAMHGDVARRAASLERLA